MGLLGKTLNNRTTLQKSYKKIEKTVFKILDQQEIEYIIKEKKKKLTHLQESIEKEKIMNNLNKIKLKEAFIVKMKDIKSEKILEQIYVKNQVFER